MASFPGNEAFGEKELLRLEGKFMTFPREGNFTSSHFFASKDVMGREETQGKPQMLLSPRQSSLVFKVWVTLIRSVFLCSWEDAHFI